MRTSWGGAWGGADWGIMGDSHILVSVRGFDVPSAGRVREVFRSSPHRPSPLPARSFCRLGLCVLQVLKTLLSTSSPCSTSPRTRRWWRDTAGIEPTGRWGGLVKSRCVSGAGGCVRYVRCLCLSLTDSYMPALVPCRTSCTLPARGLRPQGLDGRLGAAGGRKSGRVCYLLARRSLKAAPRVVGVTSRDVRT